ncbi:MAG: lipase maturation factor family protein, partial [Patescibacteria group bacterium]
MPKTPPPIERPIVVYDGDCRFCGVWINRWKAQTGEAVDYVTSQSVGEMFHGIPQKQFKAAVCFIGKDGNASFGAAAVFRLCAEGMRKKFWWWCYQRVPGFKQLTEASYRLIASHRKIAYRITKLFWGDPAPKSTFRIASNLGVRLIGVVFLIAFWSLRDQIVLLVGSGGLLPFNTALATFHTQIGALAYWHAPTLTWFNSSDQFLRGMCTVGAVASLFVILDIFSLPALLVCFACYLSMFTVGQEFMGFQWDLLLLESGFLAILLVISRRWKTSEKGNPFVWVVWLFQWLVFRLFFESGAVKLLSGDSTWRNLTALTYHFQTQPMPTPLAWYASHLPLWFLQVSTFSALAIELVVPFFIFAPRRVRHWAAALFIFFQVLIALTGNYGFFNLLSIVLCLFLLDDAWFERWSPKRFVRWMKKRQPKRRVTELGLAVFAVVVACIFMASAVELADLFVPTRVPAAASRFVKELQPLGIVNRYGLFAVMTTQRYEVVIEGSEDGVLWKEYPFAYKVGNNLNRAPSFVAPYLPRFDWQMWFVALSPSFQDTRWFLPLMTQLLNGKGFARFLFASNPFPQKPPLYVRAMLYQYQFSPTHAGGAWWTRTSKGYYFPPVTLDDLQTAEQNAAALKSTPQA